MADLIRSVKATPVRIPPLDEYRQLVSQEMTRIYGLSWDDACGDDDPLEEARLEETMPLDFVRGWGEKYGLDPINGW